MFARPLFTVEHEMLRRSVARFAEGDVAPRHDGREKDGAVSREFGREAGTLGFLCVAVPEAQGGPGADFPCAAGVQEEMARRNLGGPGLSIHSDIVAPCLVEHASEALKRARLPNMRSGEAVGVGSDPAAAHARVAPRRRLRDQRPLLRCRASGRLGRGLICSQSRSGWLRA